MQDPEYKEKLREQARLRYHRRKAKKENEDLKPNDEIPQVEREVHEIIKTVPRKKKNVDESIRQNPNYILIEGNLCDEKLVKQILYEYQITHII